ncbi:MULTISPECIES: CBS domain-containing protein [Pseudonocardia]|uniref:CBS domain protein n=2 Tax=Pseudonocardia TaxID=1847 RepID=A0A1Y2N8Y3_PSEAH|nr:MULTISPECIES: CBS domain-containing protein [Pseudonocardia]OSY43932.1 CBS domain protein [Pseudonocardia autotrophica]TDN74335.1 CBS domain-containing protein [Pseudonocardia autotrophica]BBG05099.1 hypothetical protein Pdca_63080 [Pseudonocardia autotrophica]GEC28204.1 hypothetical protein PSA01_52330 [Pseudonocardia saturnea]
MTGTVVGQTVASAMHTFPKTCGPATTVAQARELFGRPKVHALLVVEGGLLRAVVERADLAGLAGDAPAVAAGGLAGRTVGPAADLRDTWDGMAREGRRRLAVVGDDGRLRGLLCLKRTGRGFCSDEGIRARERERAGLG